MRVLSLRSLTVPDVEGGRRLYGLDDLSDEDCLNVMRHQCRESAHPGDEALGPHLRRISGMAWAVLDEDERPSLTALSAGTRQDEPALLAAVFEAVDGIDRLVVRSQRCLDLVRVRALLHGIPGPGAGWPAGEVVDLAGPLGGVPYREFMSLAGLPGVGDGLDAVAWAEVEAIGQLLVERRLALLEGRSTAAGHARLGRAFRSWLAADDRPHLRALAGAWPGDGPEGGAWDG